MRRYADTYSLMTRPSNEDSFQYGKPAILLISGDVNFASDLSDLRYRLYMTLFYIWLKLKSMYVKLFVTSLHLC